MRFESSLTCKATYEKGFFLYRRSLFIRVLMRNTCRVYRVFITAIRDLDDDSSYELIARLIQTG